MDAGVFESAPVQSPPGSHHRPGAHHRDRNRVLSFPQNAGGTAEKESLVAFRASTELSRGRDSGRRPFLGAPSRLSSDRTGGSVISTLEEKDSYDVGGAKSDGHGGAESSCQKHEDTFEHDVPLSETEPMIRSLTEKVWSASRKESRIPRTVVLKLKTSDFNILTRSHTPSSPPSSCEELTTIALALLERVELSTEQRFRLVGIGLSNFREPEATQAQPALFE